MIPWFKDRSNWESHCDSFLEMKARGNVFSTFLIKRSNALLPLQDFNSKSNDWYKTASNKNNRYEHLHCSLWCKLILQRKRPVNWFTSENIWIICAHWLIQSFNMTHILDHIFNLYIFYFDMKSETHCVWSWSGVNESRMCDTQSAVVLTLFWASSDSWLMWTADSLNIHHNNTQRCFI